MNILIVEDSRFLRLANERALTKFATTSCSFDYEQLRSESSELAPTSPPDDSHHNAQFTSRNMGGLQGGVKSVRMLTTGRPS